SVRGTLLVDESSFQAPSLTIVPHGYVEGWGTLAARMSIADSAQLYCANADPDSSTRFAIGDSTATNGFASTGTCTLDSDTLDILNKGVAELGNIWISQNQTGLTSPVLRVPGGGHIAGGKTLSLTSDATVVGPIINDGGVVQANFSTFGFA